MGRGQTVSDWRVGRAHGPAARLAEDDRGIWCWICGRPLGQGEDIGPWRLRTARPSPRWVHELRPICPAHYEPPDQGQAPPEADLSQGGAQVHRANT